MSKEIKELTKRVEALEEYRDLNMTSHSIIRCPGCDAIVRPDEHICPGKRQS